MSTDERQRRNNEVDILANLAYTRID